jgi:hypothetical protein
LTIIHVSVESAGGYTQRKGNNPARFGTLMLDYCEFPANAMVPLLVACNGKAIQASAVHTASA